MLCCKLYNYVGLCALLCLMTMSIKAQVPSDLPWAAGENCLGEQTYLNSGQLVAACGVTENSPTSYTMGVIDPTNLTYNTNTQMPAEWHHPDWTLEKIGNIYFTEPDPNGYIYATASAITTANIVTTGSFEVPSLSQFGSIGGGANDASAAGTVYRMDNETGAPMVWAVLPQQLSVYKKAYNYEELTYPGLAGVTYYSENPLTCGGCNLVLIANLEDGKVYAFYADDPGPYPLTAADAAFIFDPLTPDNGVAGMPANYEDRVFGMDIYNGRLYYTVHGFDPSIVYPEYDNPAGQLIVRSVAINNCAIDPSTDQLEIKRTIESLGEGKEGSIVTGDIDISANGQMAVGTFTTPHSYIPNVGYYAAANYIAEIYNHEAGVHIFELNAGTWTETAYSSVGQEGYWDYQANSTSQGGVAWDDCRSEDILWMSGGDFNGENGNWGIIGYDYNQLDGGVNQENATNYIQFLFEQELGAGDVDEKGFGADVDAVTIGVSGFCQECCTINCEIVSEPTGCLTNDGSVTVNMFGTGLEPYTFLWSDGQTTQTAIGLNPGTYTITVTDANNDTYSCTVILAAPGIPVGTCNLNPSTPVTPLQIAVTGTETNGCGGDREWANLGNTTVQDGVYTTVANLSRWNTSGCLDITMMPDIPPCSAINNISLTMVRRWEGDRKVSDESLTVTTGNGTQLLYSTGINWETTDTPETYAMMNTTIDDLLSGITLSLTVSTTGGLFPLLPSTDAFIDYVALIIDYTPPYAACNNAVDETFTLAPFNKASSYTWTLPAGASVVSGDGTGNVTVNFGGIDAGIYDVCVTPTNDCGTAQECCVCIELTDCIPPYDLRLGKTVDQAQATVGSNVTFTITVYNEGSNAVTGATVTDVLPSGLLYITDDANGAYSSSTGIWTIGNMAAGDSATLNLTVQITDVGVITNEASVTINETETDITNNTDRTCVSVPIELCDDGSQTLTAEAEAGFTSYQWYLDAGDGNGYVAIVGATQQTLSINTAGTYIYAVNDGALGDCGDQMCCPIIVSLVPCPVCPPDLCIPITVTKR